MILLSVGTQFPFPRLVNAVDCWAKEQKNVRVVAQIGAETTTFPHYIEYFDFMPAGEFEKLQQECDLMVSHAGIGSIMKAIEFKKPIIIMPRLQRMKEHRNDHQLSSARYLFNFPNVYVARDEFDLMAMLNGYASLSYVDGIHDNGKVKLRNNLRQILDAQPEPSLWARVINHLRL